MNAQARCLALLALPAFATSVRADVLIVDIEGLGDFTTVTAAVAAAADGDVVLVRPGFYSEVGPIVLDDKALTISGADEPSLFSPDASIQPGVIVRNLSPGKHVFLENITLIGTPGSADDPATPALTIEDSVSHVRIQAAWLRGGGGGNNANPDGAPGMVGSDCDSVALIDTNVEGGQGLFSPHLGVVTGDGAAGILWSGDQLVVVGDEVIGGAGGSNNIGGWPDGGLGAAGIDMVDGNLWMVGAGARGGDGGTAHTGGDGGDGIVIGFGATATFMSGGHADGGDGGWSDAGPDGDDGSEVVDPFGTLNDLGGNSHGFEVTSPLREGETGTLDFDGDPGDVVLLFLASSLHSVPFPNYQGVALINPAASNLIVLGGPGTQNVDFTAPALGGADSLKFFLQPAYVGVDGVVLGAGYTLTLLNDAF